MSGSLRVPGIVLGAMGILLFALGLVIDIVRPVPQCAPPRGMLCAAEGHETLRLVVPGMWVVSIILLTSGMILLLLHWRRMPRTSPAEHAEHATST